VGDYHIHPDYSVDAEGSLDDYCRMAFNLGLSEICFTTHYDVEPSRPDFESLMVIEGNKEKISDETLQHYFDNIGRVHMEYGGIGILIRSGLEFGFFDGCEKHFAKVQSKFPIHFRLGAVHSIDNLCICHRQEAAKLFSKMTLTQMADRYFEILDKCAATGLFDCMAHLDIYRRFGLEYYGEEINTIHRGRIEKLFQTMLMHDTGFELNTSAIRHGHMEYYPCMEIVNMARVAGVRLIALGSDAHRPDDLALDFEAASAVAYELLPYVDE
jgi:histidinol-phosphatase (PHP family)